MVSAVFSPPDLHNRSADLVFKLRCGGQSDNGNFYIFFLFSILGFHIIRLLKKVHIITLMCYRLDDQSSNAFYLKLE